MPYGVTDEQWASMNDYGRYLAKQAYEKKQKSTATTTIKPMSTPTTNNPYGVPAAAWDSLPEAARTKAISSGGSFEGYSTSTKRTPIAAKTPLPQQQQQSFDIYDYIRELEQARLQQQLAALEAARTRALSGLESTYLDRQAALERARSASQTNLETSLQQSLENLANEEAKIKPYFYDARNQVAAASDVGALNFAQYMASRGVQGSAAGMPEIYRNAALQGQIGALNRQEAAARSEIERTRSTTQNQYQTNLANISNQYESDLALLEQEYLRAKEGIREAYEQDMLAARSGISAQGLQALIDQLNADRLFSLNEAQLTGRYGGQPTLQALLQEAQLTGMYGGTPTLEGLRFQLDLQDRAKQDWLSTIDRFYDNFQAEIDRVANDNDTTNDWQIPYLQAARQQKIQRQAEEAAAAAAAKSEAERQQYLDALEEWKLAGVASARVAAILGIEEGDRTADYDIKKIEANIKQQQLKNTTEKEAAEKSSQKVKQYASQIDNLFVTVQYDANGRAVGKTFDPAQVKAYIQNLHQTGQINDNEARQLLAMYNFTY